MDPYICCLLGICCPPNSPEQLDAFVKVLMSDGTDEAKATSIAKALQKDLVAFTKKLARAKKAAA